MNKNLIYTQALVNIKPQSLTCGFSAIGAWIFIQQEVTQVL